MNIVMNGTKSLRNLRKYILLHIAFLLIVGWALDSTALAQQNKKNQKKPPDKKAQKVEQKSELDEEIEGSDFVYKPRGRRDPFWDLLKGKSVKIRREAKEGIEGLLIDELELEGILSKETGVFIALFKGPDGRPYDVKVGDSVYDGEIIKIDINSVVFKRILTIALGGTKEKIITKRLIPEEEASKK